MMKRKKHNYVVPWKIPNWISKNCEKDNCVFSNDHNHLSHRAKTKLRTFLNNSFLSYLN